MKASWTNLSRGTIRENCFCGQKNKKKNRERATFFQVFGFNFRLGSQNCSLSVHRSIFRYYFYCQKRHFFNVSLIGAETFPTPGDFSRQYFKTRFLRPEVHFQVECFFEKFSAFVLRVLGIYWKNFTFCQKFKAGGPNCNEHVQRSSPRRKVFWIENSEKAVGLKFAKFLVQKLHLGCQKCPKQYQMKSSQGGKTFFCGNFQIKYYSRASRTRIQN